MFYFSNYNFKITDKKTMIIFTWYHISENRKSVGIVGTTILLICGVVSYRDSNWVKISNSEPVNLLIFEL